jgi:hypothetical protein
LLEQMMTHDVKRLIQLQRFAVGEVSRRDVGERLPSPSCH